MVTEAAEEKRNQGFCRRHGLDPYMVPPPTTSSPICEMGRLFSSVRWFEICSSCRNSITPFSNNVNIVQLLFYHLFREETRFCWRKLRPSTKHQDSCKDVGAGLRSQQKWCVICFKTPSGDLGNLSKRRLNFSLAEKDILKSLKLGFVCIVWVQGALLLNGIAQAFSLCNQTIVIASSIKETVESNWHRSRKSIYQVWLPRNVAIPNAPSPWVLGDLEILNNIKKNMYSPCNLWSHFWKFNLKMKHKVKIKIPRQPNQALVFKVFFLVLSSIACIICHRTDWFVS